MAVKADDKVKVKALTSAADDKAMLWGVNFVRDGDFLVAELSKEDAEIMIEAGRVVKA